MTVCRYESCADLLRDLHDLQGEPYSGTWLFRGQACGSWGLVPSLFRQQKLEPRRFENLLLRQLRHDLGRKSTLPDRLIEDENYVLAFAQHYGCPTRLLDWTLSPLVAAYFAASGALRAPGTEPMAIYAIANIIEGSHHLGETRVIHPPSAANPNLAAQNGVLVKHDWTCKNLWMPQFERPELTAAPEVTADVESRFIRFELPRSTANELLGVLEKRGVDAAALFPGPHGFATAAADLAWLAVHDE